jgi:hypothetical protein
MAHQLVHVVVAIAEENRCRFYGDHLLESS